MRSAAVSLSAMFIMARALPPVPPSSMLLMPTSTLP
jgi:hypothetical protein